MTALQPLAGKRILVAVSGSIAAVKVPLLVSALVKQGAQVRCLLSPSAAQLVSPVALACLSRNPCLLEQDQWQHSQSRPLHIELAEWPDVVLLVPLSASTLARLVQGSADTLLAATLLACRAPLLVAAAMNTEMWLAPAVQRNWQQLRRDQPLLALPPAQDGLLACDRQGSGRMVEPELIVLAAESLVLHGVESDLQGLKLLVTAGPTREPLDPARYLSNPSSGRMGVLLAQAARLRGAEVVLLHGPLALPAAWLEGLACQPFSSAAELEQLLQVQQPQVDAVVMAAAVADQRLRRPLAHKLPKQELQHALVQAENWEPVPDLLQQLVQRRLPGQVLVGFAAQSRDVLSQAEAKFRRKGCDLLFANPIDQAGAGFAETTNEGWLLQQGAEPQRMDSASKLALAHRLLNALRQRWVQAADASESSSS
ncbi:MAG: bifunctional phosphopantothenoylcysteine decarboxylase/phosphopantothenate--cysteine ligase CoaBC [Synechococcus sp.]|nr:bifunctional phosphopantothenoylcysteine decarboxylase/phosphopantothenate--cysteine ligase CoaBC [Synechococcus sp.]